MSNVGATSTRTVPTTVPAAPPVAPAEVAETAAAAATSAATSAAENALPADTFESGGCSTPPDLSDASGVQPTTTLRYCQATKTLVATGGVTAATEDKSGDKRAAVYAGADVSMGPDGPEVVGQAGSEVSLQNKNVAFQNRTDVNTQGDVASTTTLDVKSNDGRTQSDTTLDVNNDGATLKNTTSHTGPQGGSTFQGEANTNGKFAASVDGHHTSQDGTGFVSGGGAIDNEGASGNVIAQKELGDTTLTGAAGFDTKEGTAYGVGAIEGPHGSAGVVATYDNGAVAAGATGAYADKGVALEGEVLYDDGDLRAKGAVSVRGADDKAFLEASGEVQDTLGDGEPATFATQLRVGAENDFGYLEAEVGAASGQPIRGSVGAGVQNKAGTVRAGATVTQQGAETTVGAQVTFRPGRR